MLSPDYLEHVADDIIELYSNFEQSIISDLVKRILKTGGLVPSTQHQANVLQESGMVYNDIIKEISKLTGKSEKAIRDIFNKSAIKSISLDDKVYKKAGLNPLPITQSKSLLDVLIASINKTNSDLKNLTLTTAGNGQAKFINAVNLAYMQITSGAFDKNTAIMNAIKNLTDDGIDIVYPSGKVSKIDVAVRRAVLTGVNQTCGKMQEIRADDMECDLMELTAHPGARVTEKNDYTNHAWWQGKIVSRSGKSGYLSLNDIGYGEIQGFLGINCRHGWSPFFEGISKRRYTDEELQNINSQTVKYNGTDIGLYEANKVQRRKERDIRELKRKMSAYKSIMQNSDNQDLKNKASIKYNSSNKKLKEKTEELKDFTTQTDLQRDYTRERVYNKANVNKVENKKISGIIKSSNTKMEDSLNSKITLVENITDLSDESKVNTLKKYEEKILNKDVENAIVIDKEGNIYFIEGNSKNSIYIKNLGEEKLKDSYMTHNHPKNETYFSFSSYDISEFMEMDINKLRGVDYKYVYEIEKIEGTIKPDRDTIMHEFCADLRNEALEIIRNDKLDVDEDEYHIINQLLAKKYNYKYRRIKNE